MPGIVQPAAREEAPTESGPAAELRSLRFLERDALVLRAPQPARFAPQVVESAGKEELSIQPAAELREVLQIQPGISVSEDGGAARPASPTIRGSLPRHVRVMLDDIPLNFPDEGRANVNLIPFVALDWLQVWKGGSSSVYGSGLGGTILARTIDPPATAGCETRLQTRAGTWGSSATEGRVSLRKGKLGVVAAGSYEHSDGFRLRSGFWDRRGFGKVTYDLGENSRLLVMGGVSESELEEFAYPEWGFWQQPGSLARYGQASLELGRSTDLECAISSYLFDHFSHRDTNDLASADRWSRDELGSTVMGVRGEVARRSSHDIGGLRFANRAVLGANAERNIVDSDDVDDPLRYSQRGLFLRDTLSFNRLALTLGCRFDDTAAYGDYVSPEIGLMVRVLDKDRLVLRGQADRSFSAPPVYWRYVNSPFVQANESIQAEEAENVSAGFDLDLGAPLFLRCSLMRSDIDNALTTRFLDPPVRMLVNEDKHRRQGVEIETAHRWRRLVLRTAGWWGEVENTDTRAEVRGRVKRSYRVGVDYQAACGISLGLQGRYDDWNEDPEIEPDVRHMLWDARLGYKFQVEEVAAEVFLAGRNIFDADWALNEYTRMPGASAQLGLSVTF